MTVKKQWLGNGKMEVWKKAWELKYEKDMKFTRRNLENMKSQMEKRKSKTVYMDVDLEVHREKLTKQEDVIKELQEKVKHLELEQSLGFLELHHSPSPAVSAGSFGHEQGEAMEEDTKEQHSKQAKRTTPIISSSIVVRMKIAHYGHGKKHV